MRITNNMMVNRSLRDINSNLGRLDKTEREISSETRISRPSDDPAGMARVQVLRTNLAQNAQYDKNIDYAQGHLAMSDSTMSKIVDVLHNLHQRAIQAGNGSLNDQDRAAIAKEVQEMREELVTLGNTQFNGRYIFGGIKVDQTVFPPDPTTGTVGSGVTLGPNDKGKLSLEVAPNVTTQYNVTGVDVFGDTTGPNNMFAAVDQFLGYLTSNDPSGISADSVAAFDKYVNSVSQQRTEIGAKLNRVELTKNRLADLKINLSDMLSKTADTNIAEASVRMSQQQATYQASLAVAAKAIPMSLLDFLR